jgi:hypothetical protein
MMKTQSNSEAIEQWIKHKIKNKILVSGLLGIFAFVGGIVILLFTFWMIYLVVMIGTAWLFPMSHTVLCVVALILIGLLFWGNARTSREYLTDYSFTTGTVSNEIVTFYIPGLGVGSNINPLAPDSMHSGIKGIVDILYTGPRVLTFSVKNLLSIYSLVKLDVSGCTKVIDLLFKAQQKLPFTQIASELPGLNFCKVFTDLKYLDGVIFLSTPPPGLSLNDTVVQEIYDASIYTID